MEMLFSKQESYHFYLLHIRCKNTNISSMNLLFYKLKDLHIYKQYVKQYLYTHTVEFTNFTRRPEAVAHKQSEDTI